MKKECLISARDKLKERATSLWNRLSCPEPEGEAFREAAMSTLSDDIRRVRAFACNSQDVLSGILTPCGLPMSANGVHFLLQWQGYVEHLEELQMVQLEEVVDKVRQELVVLWDKCMLGPDQREPFSVHFCDGKLPEPWYSCLKAVR